MSKGSRRRANQRKRDLSRLANENPKKFRYEWSKRLESWQQMAKIRANYNRDQYGQEFPGIFKLIDEIREELRTYGENAVKLEEQKTIDEMNDVFTHEIARVVDKRIHQLNDPMVKSLYLISKRRA